MPNWCSNNLYVSGTKKDIAEFKEKAKTEKEPHRIIKTYNVSNLYGRKLEEKKLAKRGYYPVEEEELKKYSAGKGIALGLIFLPLALLGGVKKVRVTYEHRPN